MLNTKSLLYFTLIITNLIQYEIQAMRGEQSTNFSLFYHHDYLPVKISQEATFFKALLEHTHISIFTDYLFESPEKLQFKNVSSYQHFKRCINLYLYQNEISLSGYGYDLFCNPLQGNNLIQLIYYAHSAGLSVIEIEKIRLLSLAIYAPNAFHAIAQMQTGIMAGNLGLIDYLINMGIQMNWIATYAGRSQADTPLYNYVIIQNQNSPVQDWHACMPINVEYAFKPAISLVANSIIS